MAQRPQGGPSAIWGGATFGLIVGVVAGAIVGNITFGMLIGLIVGAGAGVVANLLGKGSDGLRPR